MKLMCEITMKYIYQGITYYLNALKWEGVETQDYFLLRNCHCLISAPDHLNQTQVL